MENDIINITQQYLDNLFNSTAPYIYKDVNSGITYNVAKTSCTDNDYLKFTNQNNNDEHVYERPKPIEEDTNPEWLEVTHIKDGKFFN